MTLSVPACITATRGHCITCTFMGAPICCECGSALVPWHPDIQHLYVSGAING